MITETMLDELRVAVRSHMREERYLHTLGVEKEIRYLAARLAPDLIKEAAAAALLHDVTKFLTLEEQVTYAREKGIALTEDELAAPALVHAKTGAYFAKQYFPDFASDAVCEAIEKHTTLAVPFTLLDAMLFLADFTEEGRTYPECKALRDLLHAKLRTGETDMDRFREVLLAALVCSCTGLLHKKKHIARGSVEAYNALVDGKRFF
ncbi:MAG: bis(5'-nucleosyl)-tetraphosphatase (symmetrical) YqeK [Clostridia bacterium]|nr:bis(5'-nucleosyl)-tetraphosphatase (symmetrical) YqeK [Clostridia bacterium]